MELKPKVFKHIGPSKKRSPFYLPIRRLRWIAAAVFIMMGIVSTFYFTKNETAISDKNEIMEATHILPGTNRGIVTANGKSLMLDEGKGELILTANGLKYNDGQVLTTAQEDINVYIPKGGTYKVLLPDGSAVWLNSDTKLEIPEGFNNQNRTVNLDGEAYFEVKKGTSPFLVHSQTQTIEVLGTSFNVKAYRDETITKTTLINGSLRVSTQKDIQLIKPNEECIVNVKDNSSFVKKANPDPSSSWKEGYFNFDAVPLADALKMVGRWYDIEIEGVERLPDIQLGGKMSKGVRLSVFLKFLEANYNIVGTMKANKTLVVQQKINFN
jgi:hypothetical protein